jgi:hypothetical protein
VDEHEKLTGAEEQKETTFERDLRGGAMDLSKNMEM